MKKWLLHIIVCLSAFLMNACTNEVDTISKDENKVKLQLHLALPVGETQGISRADVEIGTEMENYVDFTDATKYRIYLFDMNNQFIARFIPELPVEKEIVDQYILYSIKGEIPNAIIESGTTGFKIAVMANWPNYQAPFVGVTKLEDICNNSGAVFNHLDNFQLSSDENRLIPFYGVQEYENITFETGKIELEEPIHLLRAMAKVEVILDTSDDENGKYQTDVSFSKVVVHNYNSQGYCAPSGVYEQADYVYSNGNFIENLSLHVVDNVKVNDELPFLQVNERSDTENETWIAYLPEYDNSGDDYSYIEVKLDFQIDTSIDTSYQIYFSEYANGVRDETKPFFNIARNNLYRFNVRIRNGKLLVNVQPWDHAYDNDYTFE